MSGIPARADILAVDDTPANLRVLSELLKRNGYRVRSVTSAEMALTAIEAQAPDLILLDVRMPDMDGYQLAAKLKSDPRFADIPILFVSALEDVENKVKAFEAGGQDYLTKPIEEAEVLARVDTHLRLRRLQSHLERRVEELDAFARTVAHDLKTPLNAIIGYSELLEEELAPELARSDSCEVLMRLIASGRRMSGIIDSLLLLANVSRSVEPTLASLDMDEIMSRVLSELDHMIKSSGAELSLPRQWPPALGYGPWVEAVWRNYLSNAIKYGGSPPRLELGAEREGAAVRFWVRDNGSGVDPAERGKLFTPYTRLYEECGEGHGLGLSIVQGIIQRLGGTVGVAEDAGPGACFYFTLPAAEAG